jgi:hypothetical protein
MQLLIDPEEVEAIFSYCLYKTEELGKGGKAPEDAKVVDGIAGKVYLHPGRLEVYRNQVKTWLSALPHEFRRNSGGGWSFLEACYQSDGKQWTGLQLRMGQLFYLVLGLGIVECTLPREMWPILPGGMPYYIIDIE